MTDEEQANRQRVESAEVEGETSQPYRTCSLEGMEEERTGKEIGKVR
jgi:hypothetical protein